MPAPQKLLFIDTNIWLNFYRGRGADLSLKLLDHVQKISSKLVITYQVQMEFKKNRQGAILDGISELRAVSVPPRFGIFSDNEATAGIAESAKQVKKHISALKSNLAKALKEPEKHDPVYIACELLFSKSDNVSLLRSNPVRRTVRERAQKRFLHGYPPRKKGDTSFGDALNWEWMVECAKAQDADLVIVSQDSDYGSSLEDVCYPNDHLRQEFTERVGKKRSVSLHHYLTDALALFAVNISPEESQAERLTLDIPDAAQKALEVLAHQSQVEQLRAKIQRLSVPGASSSASAYLRDLLVLESKKP